MDNKRIYVYSESEPLDRNVVAHGLYRAASPILRSIHGYLDGIAIYPIGLTLDSRDLDRELAPLCVSLPRLPTLFCKTLRRYPLLDFGISDRLPAWLLAPFIRKSSAGILFCFIGADIGTVTRAARLATLAGRTCVFYVVDDFFSPLRQTGMGKDAIRKVTEQAQEALRAAAKVFTITDGLGELLRQSCGVASITLSLAFETTPRPIAPLKNQIIYLGSINFLYADGLRTLFKTVEQVRMATGVDLMVRLTQTAKIAMQELGPLPEFVQAAPVETAEGLASEIASSLFAFLPYTFDPQHRTMVATSFPSKSMEYLAYARSIVVCGPDYGVATQYFRRAGLPCVVSSPAELEDMILTHLSTQPDFSAMYREYLASTHSLVAARKTLCAGLDLDL